MDGVGARAFRSPALVRVLAGAACLLCVGLFVAASSHSQWLVYPLIPDEVVLSTFGGGQLEFALLDRLPAAMLAVAAAVISQGIGFAGLTALRLRSELRVGERLGLGFAIGMSSLSTWTLAVGTLVGLTTEWLILAPPAIAAMVGWWLERRRIWPPRQLERSGGAREVATWPQSVASGRESGRHKEAGGDQCAPRWLSWVWVPFATLGLLGAILPPWEFDVLEYHLQVPREWREAGRIQFLGHNVYGNMPLGAEMAALWSMTLATGEDAWFHGALAGKTLIALFTIGVALALGSIATRESGQRTGAIASALFLSTPWILHTAMAGLVDSVLAGYVLFAFYAWHRARSATDASLSWMALAGWMAGAAAATKYTGVVFAVLPIAVATVAETLLVGWRERRSVGASAIMRLAFARAAIFIVAAAVSGGGWYLKNGLTTGNPVYPLMAGVAGPGLETVEQRTRWSQAHRPGGSGSDGSRSAYGVRELLSAAAQVGWRSPWQSPLLPPLVLMTLVFLRRWRELLPWLAPPLWILAVWWLATHRIDRFWIPALPFAALLASRGVEVLDTLYGRRWVDGILAVMLAWLLLIGASPGTPDEPFANNRFFVPLARLRESQTHPAHQWLNTNMPATGKVLLVGDARPFYLRRPAVYNTCFDVDGLSKLLADPSPAACRAAFREAHITHVFIDWSELARYRSPGNYGHSSVATPAFVHGELVERQRLLRPISATEDRDAALLDAIQKVGGELFEVILEPSSPSRGDGGGAVR
ncbi:MAG: hypothetical protein ACKO38_21445 [Planctomycetota bacterium]